MPTTRKQKKARKSRGAEMLSDIVNLDIMLRGNHLEREREVSLAIQLGDLIVQISMHQKIMRTVILILGKIDQVTLPIMAITQLVQTLVQTRASSI